MLRVRPLRLRFLAILAGAVSALSDEEDDPTQGAGTPNPTETAEP
jgi:hypothetical protein